MKVKSVQWGRLVAETLAIVFGVLLALVLDDWRQSRDEQEVVDSLVVSMLAELERNQLVLESRLPYHEAMLDTFRTRIEQLSMASGSATDPPAVAISSLEALGFPKNLGVDVSLATSAWAVTRASGVVDRLGPDVLFVLSAAYTTQEDLSHAVSSLREKYDDYRLAQIEGYRPTAALVGFTYALSDVIDRERILCDGYRILARKLAVGNETSTTRCGSGNVAIR